MGRERGRDSNQHDECADDSVVTALITGCQEKAQQQEQVLLVPEDAKYSSTFMNIKLS